MKLSKSQAHYIKAVYELSFCSEDGSVRVMDIAERLSLSKASASFAMTKLVKDGLVRRDAEHHVYLTQQGETEAIRMLNKFDVIQRFLTEILHVKEEVAKQDACAMEHVISMDTLCVLCRLINHSGAKKKCTGDCSMMR